MSVPSPGNGRLPWRFQRALTLLLILIALAILWLGLRAREPRYQGRSLHAWLQQLDQAPPWYRDEPGWAPEVAIQALGTNNLPYLAHALTNKDSSLHSFIEGPLSKYLKISVPSAGRYHRAAARAFKALGPAAKPAIPLLVQVLNTEARDSELDYEVAGALAAVGQGGWPPLIAGLTSTNQLVRISSVNALANARIAAPETIMALMIGATNGGALSSLNLPCLAALGKIGQDGDRVVPFLITRLPTTNVNLELVVAEALAGFGNKAESGVPALVEIVRAGPSPALSFEEAVAFTNRINAAINRVDPEAAKLARCEWPALRLDPGIVSRPIPDFQRWLALGADIPLRPPQGVALAEWRNAAKDAEPRHEGRSLREWLVAAVPPPSALPSATTATMASAWESSRRPIAAIGTNALPWLLAWLETEPSEDAHVLALRGMTFLGKDARPALRGLVELIQTGNEPTRNLAYGALRRLELPWETAWPALVPVLHREELELRAQAAEFLWHEYLEAARHAGLRPFIGPFGLVRESETE